ncbi:hypothetical protein LINGRAHAP2_LOCUS3379 [Linum grandiflorum]
MGSIRPRWGRPRAEERPDMDRQRSLGD